MLKIFSKPYPAPQSGMRSLLISLGVGIFVGTFLAYFQPFQLNELNISYKTPKILGFGIPAFLSVALFSLLLPWMAPKYVLDKHWTVGKEILRYLAILLIIAILNTMYTQFLTQGANKYSVLKMMIPATLIIGILPTTFIVLLDYNRKLKKHVSAAETLEIAPTKATENDSLINIDTEVSNENLVIKPNKFLYAEADGNYVQVVHEEKGNLDKNMFRITLTKLHQQIPINHIIKCHRSFIVNLDKVVDVKGNAQGFKLNLENTSDQVSVSRKYVPEVKEYFAVNS